MRVEHEVIIGFIDTATDAERRRALPVIEAAEAFLAEAMRLRELQAKGEEFYRVLRAWRAGK